jgi:hypothetical protein
VRLSQSQKTLNPIYSDSEGFPSIASLDPNGGENKHGTDNDDERRHSGYSNPRTPTSSIPNNACGGDNDSGDSGLPEESDKTQQADDTNTPESFSGFEYSQPAERQASSPTRDLVVDPVKEEMEQPQPLSSDKDFRMTGDILVNNNTAPVDYQLASSDSFHAHDYALASESTIVNNGNTIATSNYDMAQQEQTPFAQHKNTQRKPAQASNLDDLLYGIEGGGMGMLL